MEPLILSASGRTLPHNPKVASYGFEPVFIDIGDLAELCKTKHYSPQLYKNGVRKISELEAVGNTIILDIDNTEITRLPDGQQVATRTKGDDYLDFYDAIDMIEMCEVGAQALLITTKSHKPDWHKFRIILPVNGQMLQERLARFDVNYREVTFALGEIATGIPSRLYDSQCGDLGRQYAPSPPDAETYLVKGKPLELFQDDMGPTDLLKDVLTKIWDMRQKEIKPATPPMDKRPFDRMVDVSALLEKHGYIFRGRLEKREISVSKGNTFESKTVDIDTWESPRSTTKSAGVSVLHFQDGIVIINRHGSDSELFHGLEKVRPFDLYAILEHGGDLKEAAAALTTANPTN
jgi:hypothetical protein